MATRYLPESELEARRRELSAEIRTLRSQLHDAKIELRLLDRFIGKLVVVSPTGSGSEVRRSTGNIAESNLPRVLRSGLDSVDDEDEDTASPTELIMSLLGSRPGLTRDEVYDAVHDQFVSKSTNKRNVVLSILRRLVTKYERLVEMNGRYYLKGQAPVPRSEPSGFPFRQNYRDYDDFVAPPFDDDDEEEEGGPDPDLRAE